MANSPTVRSRALGAQLRKLREARHETITGVEDALSRSRGWLSRLEAGRRLKPRVDDVTALLDYYGVTEQDTREQLIGFTREARTRGWWSAYGDAIPEAYATYVGLEAGARSLHIVAPSIVPGLLQTADYAAAVISGVAPQLPGAEVARRVEVRNRRQEMMVGDGGTSVRVVLDEAVLYRMVGDRAVMRHQFSALLAMAAMPHVSLTVIPFEAGAHAGLFGPVTVLGFDGSGDDVVAIETMTGQLFIDREADVASYVEAFGRFGSVSSSAADSLRMVAAAMAAL